MSEPLMPLSNDEEQQIALKLRDKSSLVGQPYELAALMSGMLVLLVLRGALPSWHITLLVGISLTLVVVAYVSLATMQPKLNPLVLSIVAALLGMLYSMPTRWLYIDIWHSAEQLSWTVTGIIITSIVGLLIGHSLRVERYVEHVIFISFLAMFVAWSIMFIVLVKAV